MNETRAVQAAVLGLAMAGLHASSGAHAAPVPWSEAFRDERDTAVILTSTDVLLRAPFHLADRETLWTPHGEDHVVRFRVAPDGINVAWLTRGADQDTARIWIGSHAPRSPRAEFASFLPRDVGRPYFAPSTPTTRDPTVRGGRFVTPGAQHLRHASNSLEWMPDGSSVVFGYSEGLALVAPDSGAAWEISSARVVELRTLDPASIFLADLIAAVDGNRIEGWYLVYPTGARWRVFPAGGLDAEAHWTASPTSVWWTSAAGARVVHAHDPTIRTLAAGRMSGNWIRYVAERKQVFWIAGRDLMGLAQDAQRPERHNVFPEEVEHVVETPAGGDVGFAAGDSLYVWNPVDDSTRVFALPAGEPLALFQHAGNIAVVVHSRKNTLVARWPAGETTAAIREISATNVHAFATPSGSRVIIARRGWKPPDKVDVLDLASGEWIEVSNPGVVAWEPLRQW